MSGRFSAWDRIKADHPRYRPVSKLLQPTDEQEDDPFMCGQCGGTGVIGPDQTCTACNGSGAATVFNP